MLSIITLSSYNYKAHYILCNYNETWFVVISITFKHDSIDFTRLITRWSIVWIRWILYVKIEVSCYVVIYNASGIVSHEWIIHKGKGMPLPIILNKLHFIRSDVVMPIPSWSDIIRHIKLTWCIHIPLGLWRLFVKSIGWRIIPLLLLRYTIQFHEWRWHHFLWGCCSRMESWRVEIRWGSWRNWNDLLRKQRT